MNEGNRVASVDGPEGAARVTPADRTRAEGAVPVATASDGDFELAEPARPPAGADAGETPGTGVGGDGWGDVRGDAGGAGTLGDAVAATGETSWAVPAERPRPLHDPDPYSTPPYGEPARPSAGAGAGEAPGAGAGGDGGGGVRGDAGGAGTPGDAVAATGETSWAVPAERPRPLHDPDPYSTPPYGEPGPWAPAPPVQHPAATPAHGTAVSAPTAAPPTPMGMPAATAHAPAPSASVPHGTAPADPVPQVTDPWGRYDPWAAASAKEQTSARGPLQQTGEGVPTEKQRKTSARRVLFAWTLVVALFSAGVGGVAGAYVQREGLGGDVRLPQAGSVPAGRAPDSVAGIAARALPSVVTLHVRGADEAGTGTGFVLDTAGHILTNNHVVEPAGTGGEISVTFSTGDTVKAKVVGRDSGYDLAVVQVRGVHGLTPLPLGNSDDVQVGDPVVAIGAPFDLANTVTSGIISAKERPITAGGGKSDGSDVSYVDALQTDAPINPGNSGGPLLDSRAQVIGINSAIRSAGSGSEADGGQAGSIGLGFAIPVNQAKRVAEELINDGRATHPVIGVTLDMGYTGDGARIDSRSAGGGPAVTRGGPGERAGLRAGDVITEVGGERVHSGEELIVKIRAHRPGDRLRLTVERDGGEREVSLVLGASEQN
ncbi:trypsin-like peptidase domain-containing protein [Streptomyces flaveolus]|uniref:trypsin-like peptidase domain-containing protein n=1 Tax=Streptomyces flaveolus TaxID=67297 RepID=UPI0033EC8319